MTLLRNYRLSLMMAAPLLTLGGLLQWLGI